MAKWINGRNIFNCSHQINLFLHNVPVHQRTTIFNVLTAKVRNEVIKRKNERKIILEGMENNMLKWYGNMLCWEIIDGLSKY